MLQYKCTCNCENFEHNIEKNKNSRDNPMSVVRRAPHKNVLQLDVDCTQHVYVD